MGDDQDPVSDDDPEDLDDYPLPGLDDGDAPEPPADLDPQATSGSTGRPEASDQWSAEERERYAIDAHRLVMEMHAAEEAARRRQDEEERAERERKLEEDRAASARRSPGGHT